MVTMRMAGERCEYSGEQETTDNWLRLNFPSKREMERAKALGMPAVC
jgi:hypothetical protein